MLNPLEFRAMLVVADYAASLRFYETLLGLRLVMAWDNGHGPGALLSLGPGRTLDLRGARPGGGGAAGAAGGDRALAGIAGGGAQGATRALARPL